MSARLPTQGCQPPGYKLERRIFGQRRVGSSLKDTVDQSGANSVSAVASLKSTFHNKKTTQTKDGQRNFSPK